ncbi:potassium channel family protein [Chryseobacterium koreense]|uniref:potassium channel family protein n=1 Tax=Chryseobacterium koreense TaxID=232216 RepID=UPI0026F1EBF9|nr:potassium channel family protein [Chryseobacterium koreense]
MRLKDLQTESVKPFNIIIIFLSIYVLLELLISSFFKPPHEIAKLLDYIDDMICVVFLIDFLVQFSKARNKLKFMKWGWIDLVSSIPTFGYLRAGRAFRLIRLLRILRAFRSARHLINHIYKNKTQGAFTTVAVIAILMIIFSAISILQVETAPDSNIKTAEDALWWSYVTVTTVGYGDRFPVTTEGRVIAIALMTVGVGLFGTFTAFLASWFVEDNRELKKN